MALGPADGQDALGPTQEYCLAPVKRFQVCVEFLAEQPAVDGLEVVQKGRTQHLGRERQKQIYMIRFCSELQHLTCSFFTRCTGRGLPGGSAWSRDENAALVLLRWLEMNLAGESGFGQELSEAWSGVRPGGTRALVWKR